MKTMLVIAALALSGMAATAQNAETRNVTGFNAINVQNGIEVIYTHGSTESVKVECSSQNLPYVITRLKNNTLHISLVKSDTDVPAAGPVKVYVTDNDMARIEASAGAMVRVTNEIDVPRLSLELKTGAMFNGNINATEKMVLKAKSGAAFKGSIVTGELVTDIRSGAHAKLLGHAEESDITCIGGTLIAGTFTSETADIQAVNLSSVSINVKQKVKANADNSSAISYSGTPDEVILAENTFAMKRN
ncbi:DUF2807 domain-containing protein [Flavobacterium coralii]|uniref:GIN domain-containing protein n=1 Tax=Flavobacterium coralii TaxID=2838017 RepID=UPI000C48A7BE|nr:hypothetical protein [Flavobacterium sp.]|tara:strand:- start:2281 stop:3021 length:741 start_codon:yes stop_codon:yes gene_type:complete